MKEKIELPKWNNKNTFAKILHVIGLLIASSIIILIFLQLFEIYKTGNIYELLLGLLMLIQAIQYWKYDRKIAIFNLIVAIVILICVIIIFVL